MQDELCTFFWALANFKHILEFGNNKDKNKKNEA